MTKFVFRLALVISTVGIVLLTFMRLTDIPHGDAARGAMLFAGASSPYLPCIQCHEYASIAPPLNDLVARVETERLTAPPNRNETVAEYLAESIVDPDRYVVPTYASGLMPAFAPFASGRFIPISLPELQDLVAYLLTQ